MILFALLRVINTFKYVRVLLIISKPNIKFIILKIEYLNNNYEKKEITGMDKLL